MFLLVGDLSFHEPNIQAHNTRYMTIMPDPHAHIGTRLRARREALDLSVSDMAMSTNLREDYIIAIERLDRMHG